MPNFSCRLIISTASLLKFEHYWLCVANQEALLLNRMCSSCWSPPKNVRTLIFKQTADIGSKFGHWHMLDQTDLDTWGQYLFYSASVTETWPDKSLKIQWQTYLIARLDKPRLLWPLYNNRYSDVLWPTLTLDCPIVHGPLWPGSLWARTFVTGTWALCTVTLRCSIDHGPLWPGSSWVRTFVTGTWALTGTCVLWH